MNQADYENWSRHHVTVFGLGDTGAAMVGSWFAIFNGFGYTIAELRAATQTMAAAPPKWPSEHLARINETVGATRAETSRQQRLAALGIVGEPGPGDRSRCADCDDGGYVVVPHPRYVRGGKWEERYTASVVCHCWAGRRIVEANDARRVIDPNVKRPMLLAEYTRICPDWKAQLQAYEKALSEYARAIGPRPGQEDDWKRLDAAIDKALGGIASRRGQRGSAA